MKLNEYAGSLIILPDGKDGVTVLTTKDGKLIRYEEKNGKLHLSEQPKEEPEPGVGMVVIR